MNLTIKELRPGALAKEVRTMSEKWGKIVGTAQASATKRAMESARTESVRDISKTIGVKQKVIRGRIAHNRKGKGTANLMKWANRSSRLWLHYAILPPEALGSPTQTRRGVKSGKHRFDGAFLATSTRGKSAGKVTTFKRVGGARGPIQRQGLSLEPLKDVFFKAARRGFDKTYPKRLKHELDRRAKAAGMA